MTTHPTGLDVYVKERKEEFERRFTEHRLSLASGMRYLVWNNIFLPKDVQAHTAETIAGVLERVRGMVEEKRIIDLNISDYSKERKILTLQGEGYNLALDNILSQLSNPAQS